MRRMLHHRGPAPESESSYRTYPVGTTVRGAGGVGRVVATHVGDQAVNVKLDNGRVVAEHPSAFERVS